ncbi:AraC family transcriptional regulator [Roseiconus lacunae]|uniref:AraC family transcriptional regulator n=1 Tax=Roseiconus lacunae TaxID=2605694 RepID=UPI001E602CFD|nr:DNA-binding transcriptional regulator [Roseiconus lacunae]MCD0463509.1 DNA-binding transcriptional regulator [Roseiconus lacunae]
MPRKVKTRRKVALLIETSRSYGRGVLRGIARFARTRSHWSLLHQEMTIDVSLPDWMKETAISGVIGRISPRNVDSLRKLNVPCVDVRCSHRFEGIPQVETDDAKVAELAFEHLRERGFRRFAFCGFQHAHYSLARLDRLRQLAHAAGLPLDAYQTANIPGAPTTILEQTDAAEMKRISRWLRSLAPPTGLFVCNDIRGQQVLNACRDLGIAVPDDIGVIGVDDDDAICPLSDPPLSSIRPASEQIGYRAAEILDAMMNGHTAPHKTEFVAPKEVVQRLSTQVIAVEDREIARVCRFIREHACDGIDVQDVAEFTTLSRRQLERRFQSELSRTPHQEITNIQVARVRRLLYETNMTLEQIAPLAGYRHKESLSAVFKRETGQTPGEFRREQMGHDSADIERNA